MDQAEIDSWKKIKEYFDSLPEYKRDNMFYKRAVAIINKQPDPLVQDDWPSTS